MRKECLHRLVSGEDTVEGIFGQGVRVCAGCIQYEQIDHINHSYPEIRCVSLEYLTSLQYFLRDLHADSAKHYIRVLPIECRVLFPNGDTSDAVFVGLFWGKPICSGRFGADDQIDVVFGAQTVRHARYCGIRIGRKVDANTVVWQVQQGVDQAWILMRVTVVLLSPQSGCLNVVEGAHWLSPGGVFDSYFDD
jgi:hypothetical protein